MHDRHRKGQYNVHDKNEHNINVKDGYDFRNYPNVYHQLGKG